MFHHLNEKKHLIKHRLSSAALPADRLISILSPNGKWQVLHKEHCLSCFSMHLVPKDLQAAVQPTSTQAPRFHALSGLVRMIFAFINVFDVLC